tara:strand:- start:246 stop:491 length:246 start_codon:yes stop_codon:yes gene_type:complete
MNTTINSTQENSNILLSLVDSYDKIDISGVSTISGTISSMIAIIESGDFIGISSQSLILSDSSVDDSTINYFTGKGLTIIT